MVSVIQGILILFGAFAALEAFLAYQNAQSAMHQVYAGTWFIVLAICIAGIGTRFYCGSGVEPKRH